MRKVVLAVIFIGLIIAGLVYRLLPESGDIPRLTVFTYSSLMGPFGPGKRLKDLFEAECQCQVDFINTGDGGLLIQRLKMMPAEPADVVLGLDQLTLAAARAGVSWRSLNLPPIPWVADLEGLGGTQFIPFDWSPMTIIYRQSEARPASSWPEFFRLNAGRKISLQDPRTSTPGMQFLYWLHASAGPNGVRDFFVRLKPMVHSFSPSWSAAYGIFQTGGASMSFSYLTSLVYHWREEKDRRYRAMSFAEGHPLQVEFAAVPNNCRHCELAEKFVVFLLQEAAQTAFMNRNYMLPARQGLKEGTEFAELPELKTLPAARGLLSLEEQEHLVREWKEYFR